VDTTVHSTTHTSQILRQAADALGALPHPRVNAVDLHMALNGAAPTYRDGQTALDALARHLDATGGDVEWLNCWTEPRSRDVVAAEVRAAAEYADDGAVAGVR
jgi:hypothetical protein